MDNKFWTCFVEGTNGGYGHKHSFLVDAGTEAERLARLPGNLGKRVYVLELVSYCEVPQIPVVWTTVP